MRPSPARPFFFGIQNRFFLGQQKEMVLDRSQLRMGIRKAVKPPTAKRGHTYILPLPLRAAVGGFPIALRHLSR